MKITIDITEEQQSAIEYCIDNKLAVITADRTTLEDVIQLYLERSLQEIVNSVTRCRDTEILQAVKKEPDLKTQVDSVIATMKSAKTDEKVIVEERVTVEEKGLTDE